METVKKVTNLIEVADSITRNGAHDFTIVKDDFKVRCQLVVGRQLKNTELEVSINGRGWHTGIAVDGDVINLYRALASAEFQERDLKYNYHKAQCKTFWESI
jgi:hypothetical protein